MVLENLSGGDQYLLWWSSGPEVWLGSCPGPNRILESPHTTGAHGKSPSPLTRHFPGKSEAGFSRRWQHSLSRLIPLLALYFCWRHFGTPGRPISCDVRKTYIFGEPSKTLTSIPYNKQPVRIPCLGPETELHWWGAMHVETLGLIPGSTWLAPALWGSAPRHRVRSCS